MNTNQSTFHIGVDVGKHQLDFFCHESGDYFQVANTPDGIRKALKQLAPLSISRLVVEATGRHEQALVLAATRQKIPVVIAQPIAVRRFAGALGILAKTDKLDSRVIAQFAAMIAPPVRKLPDDKTRKLRDLGKRRQQVIGMLTMEQNRLQIMPTFLRADIRRSICALKLQQSKLDHQILTIHEQGEPCRVRL